MHNEPNKPETSVNSDASEQEESWAEPEAAFSHQVEPLQTLQHRCRSQRETRAFHRDEEYTRLLQTMRIHTKR